MRSDNTRNLVVPLSLLTKRSRKVERWDKTRTSRVAAECESPAWKCREPEVEQTESAFSGRHHFADANLESGTAG